MVGQRRFHVQKSSHYVQQIHMDELRYVLGNVQRQYFLFRHTKETDVGLHIKEWLEPLISSFFFFLVSKILLPIHFKLSWLGSSLLASVLTTDEVDSFSFSLKIYAVISTAQILNGKLCCWDISTQLGHILVAILVRILAESQTTLCPLCSKLLLAGDLHLQFLEVTIQQRMVLGYVFHWQKVTVFNFYLFVGCF